MKNLIFLSLCLLAIMACKRGQDVRQTISLNGTWDIAKTANFEQLPSKFEKEIRVPGMVDMAFDENKDENPFEKGVYWHKKTFTIEGSLPEIAKLKIYKAKYFTKVYINGAFVGQNPYCFTPALLNVRDYLKGKNEVNEILIGVGCMPDMPDTIMWGHDFEKDTYIPGIYDEVQLILSGYPYIDQVQTVPDVGQEKLRIVADLDFGPDAQAGELFYEISELNSGTVVSTGKQHFDASAVKADFTIELPGATLWSPENPFLYTLQLSTKADSKTVRFGMRSFHFDAESGLALLNGKPYYMRGTNVCFLRFEEDPTRGQLPWQDPWVIDLHSKFKGMHWNSLRYCIGLPPERWYDIADSLGVLIQNEYPLWTGTNLYDSLYSKVTAEHLAAEYASWMPEHWNHPSVVIWDAQNESVSDVIGQAINKVRMLDYSNRPWENGWSAPMAASDPIESHPYLFTKYFEVKKPGPYGPLHELLVVNPVPNNDANERSPNPNGSRYDNPIINNEYGWLWLNRDGSTTRLTKEIYDAAFGKGLSTEMRIELYTRNLAALTEYWRTQRSCAATLHFCGLGYSRPTEPIGETSDNFIDLENLTFEPKFVKYVKPSFAPVGLCVNWWKNKGPAGSEIEVPVIIINDLYEDWSGDLTLIILKNGKPLENFSKSVVISGLAKETVTYTLRLPSAIGAYQIKAEIDLNGEKVFSLRDIEIQ